MITTYDRKAIKEKVLQICIEKQQSLVDDFAVRIKDLLAMSVLGNEDEWDSNVLSHHAQRSDEINLLTRELHFVQEEMQRLQNLQKNIHIQDEVAPGAIVITDHITFFVSVSIEEFFIDGEPCLGLSTESPLYLQMRGKKKRDRFSYNGLEYSIIDIF